MNELFPLLSDLCFFFNVFVVIGFFSPENENVVNYFWNVLGFLRRRIKLLFLQNENEVNIYGNSFLEKKKCHQHTCVCAYNAINQVEINKWKQHVFHSAFLQYRKNKQFCTLCTEKVFQMQHVSFLIFRFDHEILEIVRKFWLLDWPQNFGRLLQSQ